MDSVEKILEQVSRGKLSVHEAMLALRKAPFADLDYAKIDLHRRLRKGADEVIYGENKSTGQIRGIVKEMQKQGIEHILITRLSQSKAKKLKNHKALKAFSYSKTARLASVGGSVKNDGRGNIAVITAGTSDIPVAEEAALSAEFLGNKVVRLYDVGVAGLHRLLAHLDVIMDARVIIAIAGMDAALPSVVGGLARCPVIAVPTSIGYGASFNGLAALLSMLNSCSSGVSVVNIDNGYGAASCAHMINHL